jgi:hypothetical protein
LWFGQSNANASGEELWANCAHFLERGSGLAIDSDSNLGTRQPSQKDLSGPMIRKSNLIIFVAAILFFICSPALAQEALSEYQVKAAYLFNFLKFVEYPTESFADPLAPIVIGVVGDDPFGSMLPQVVTGKTVQGRDLVIHLYRTGDDVRRAHILFISTSERKRLPMILSGLNGSSVLTVSDVAGFLDAGGMIQFLNENGRVRFAINVDATNRGKLKLSSKLLSLAKIVGGNVKEVEN